MALTTADGFRQHFKQDRKTELQKKLAALRVLIVEDSAFVRKMIRGLLAGMGIHKVAEAPDGFAALQALQSFQPGIILLDLEMPNLNGLQFIRRLRTRDDFTALAPRILVLTAHADRDRVIYVKENGIGGFLAKPISANGLRGHIVSILNKIQMAEAAPVPSAESNSFVLLD
jgi:two-component system, chemotaxis family, chemotaxis protein CheY